MLTSLVLLSISSPALAHSTGITGRSTSGCGGGGCHGTTPSAATTATFVPEATTVEPGATILVDFLVTNAAQSAAGLDVSATGGTLAAGSNTRLSGSEITHSSRTAMTAGTTTFEMSWTAPTTPGTYTLRGAGNAVNSNGANTGDAWNTTTTDIIVESTSTAACEVSLLSPADGADMTAQGRFVWDGDCDGYWLELSPDPTFPTYDTIFNARLEDTATPQTITFPAAAWPNVSRRFVNGGYARVRGAVGADIVESNTVAFDTSGVPSSFPSPVASCSVSLTSPADGSEISGEPTFLWNTTCTAGRLEFSTDPTFPLYGTLVIGSTSGSRATLNASRWGVVAGEFPFGGYWRVVAGATDGDHASDVFSFTVP